MEKIIGLFFDRIKCVNIRKKEKKREREKRKSNWFQVEDEICCQVSTGQHTPACVSCAYCNKVSYKAIVNSSEEEKGKSSVPFFFLSFKSTCYRQFYGPIITWLDDRGVAESNSTKVEKICQLCVWSTWISWARNFSLLLLFFSLWFIHDGKKKISFLRTKK
jgi:hypothetical protein